MNPFTILTSRRRALSTLAAPFLAAFAAIAAPAAAQGTCTTAQRDLVVYISNLDSASQSSIQRQFYNWVEFGAEAAARLALTGRYRAIHVVKGSSATRANLPVKLNSVAGNSSVLAVDLIFVTHGLSGSVKFSDTTVSMDTVRSDIVAGVPAARRAKFRMVYSTACYGQSHRSGWLGAGFATVSGSRRIHADAALAFPAFLAAWALGSTFQQSVNAANAADPLRAQDSAAKGLLWSWGYASWWDVDSVRLTSGNTALRVDRRPR